MTLKELLETLNLSDAKDWCKPDSTITETFLSCQKGLVKSEYALAKKEGATDKEAAIRATRSLASAII
jgi:hypothetical protein